MYNLLLFIYLITTIIMVTFILFQKSAGIAMQAKQNLSGPRARGNFLTKFTGFLGAVFMILCLSLTKINMTSSAKMKNASAVQTTEAISDLTKTKN